MLDTTKLREEWRGYAAVDDSFESADISLNADRIADFFISKFESHQSLNVGGWEKEFDLITSRLHWKLPELKSFIHQLLDQKTKSLLEEVEKMKVLETSLPSDEPRVLMWKQKHNKTIDDIKALLTKNLEK